MTFCTVNISNTVDFCCHLSGFISSVLDPKWLWGRGGGGGDGPAFFLLVQRISTLLRCPFASEYSVMTGRSADLGSGRNAG